MSDKIAIARKTLTFNTAAFGLSSVGIVGVAAVAIFKLIFNGLFFTMFSSVSFWALIAYIFISIPNFRGAWKAYSDMDYAKSNRKGYVAWISAAAAALLAFLA